MSMSPPTRTALLRTRTHTFCTTLQQQPPPPPSTLLTHFFTPSTPTIHEHGPSFATAALPFLGKPFVGHDACVAYFELLDATLSMELGEDAFPGPEGFVVDCDATVTTTTTGEEGEEGEQQGDDNTSKKMKKKKEEEKKGMVSVVGKGRFASKKTGKSWDETFAYRFSGFDEEGRFERWEIWADPLSAWVAVGGGDSGEGGAV